MEHLLKDFKSMLTVDYFVPRKMAERLVPDSETIEGRVYLPIFLVCIIPLFFRLYE